MRPGVDSVQPEHARDCAQRTAGYRGESGRSGGTFEYSLKVGGLSQFGGENNYKFDHDIYWRTLVEECHLVSS